MEKPSQAIRHGAWSLDELAALRRGTMVEHRGIEFTEIGPAWLKARLPVRPQTAQRLDFLHGRFLAPTKTVGSLGSQMYIARLTTTIQSRMAARSIFSNRLRHGTPWRCRQS